MKKLIMALIAVLVVGGAVGAYFVIKDDTASRGDGVESSEQRQGAVKNKSINSLLAGGQSLKCTYSVLDENGQNEGVAYFSGDKKMYGEFTNSQNDVVNTALVIRNGDTQYVWQKGTSEGYKADVSKSTEQSQKEKSTELDPDKDYEFDCSIWQKDESLFVPPTDVEFKDFSASIEASQGASEKAKEACAAITDPTARAACEGAL